MEEFDRICKGVFFDITYLDLVALTIRSNPGWNLENLKEKDNESWTLYDRYKRTSTELFYKFADGDYYLFPDWIDREKRKAFAERMKEFAPFSLNAATSHSVEARQKYQLSIAEMKDYIDVRLKKYA